MRNEVQLIAYVDRLSGGGFRALQDLFDGPFQACSAACICSRSTGPSMAPMPASTRSITRNPIPGSAHGTMCVRWQKAEI